ncbi:right-handed parallel beta-helix repeat-containing protein, partial [Singulisphaera acidiphila]
VTVATGVPLPTIGGRVASPGTGYVNGETVTFTGGLAPGGVPATGYITASGGAITGIVISTQGSGYVSSPKPTINTVAGVGGVVVPPWPEPNYDPRSHRILSISGNTLTVQGNFTVGFSSGAAVYTVWNGIASTGGGTRIYDLIMDGSRAGWTFYPWQCVAEMSLTGDRYMVQGCELYESPGEGIIAFGNYNSCLDSWIHDINGNGIHFSGVMNITVLDVVVVHGNQDQSVGHGYRAGIAWSNEISHVTCIGNYVEDCLNGFGAIKDTTNSEVTLMGNTIVNCWENGISLKCGTTDRAPKNVSIVGNRIYQCPIGIIVSHTQNNTTVFPSQVLISDNLLEDNVVGVDLNNARYVSITGNIFKGPTGAGAGPTFHVRFSRSKHINIANNTLLGNRYGVYGGDSLTENLRISGNVITNQYTQSVVIAGAKNCVVTDNILSNDATVINGYIGILAYGPAGITGNKLSLDNTNGGVVGIYLNTNMNTYTSGPNVQGNEIRGTSQNGIRTGEGQAVIANNVLTATTTMRNDTGIVTTPAVLTFTRSSGVITGVTVVSGGSYSVRPNVYASDTTGTGASFTATMSGTAIASVAVNSGGSNYTNPVASISGNYVGTNYQVI